MKAITILESVLYMNETESMGTCDYWKYDERSAKEFLVDYFGINDNDQIDGSFTKGKWLYSYNLELEWSDYEQRKENGEKLSPDVTITIDKETIIYLYKIEG